MLVEDDKSLREIYGVRLLAEGYDIVSAGDGEQALAMAIKERPNLIISDIMMPKISGFDLLDILRSTTETRNTKVIMMTALSSEDQRLRGEQLGADKYLVKSQVGIEDVVRVVHEVLGDGAQAATPNSSQQTTPTQPPVAQQTPQAQSPQQTPAVPMPPQPPKQASSAPEPAQNKSRVITPLNNPHDAKVDLNELLDKELAKEAGVAENARPTISTTEQEREAMNQQIASFTPESTSQDEAELNSILHPAAPGTSTESTALPQPTNVNSPQQTPQAQSPQQTPAPAQTAPPTTPPQTSQPQQATTQQQTQPQSAPQPQTQQPPQQTQNQQPPMPPTIPTPPPNTMPSPTQFPTRS